MLPCIEIDFFLNTSNQPDALIIHINSVIKLHDSGIFSAHHQEVTCMKLTNAECTVENS
jgi:hypothetical protein